MPPSPLTRRTFNKTVAGLLSTSLLPTPKLCQAADPLVVVRSPDQATMSLSIGNYGMQALKVEDAIRLIAGLAYDGLELTMMDNWDSAPVHSSAQRRQQLRQLIRDLGLQLVSLMEDVPPTSVDSDHTKSLDRLKSAAEFGHDLSPDRQPLIQTVLGGGTWEDKKNLYRDRVGDWLRIAESTKTVIAIKPHRRGAMSLPEQALWLRSQLGNTPWLGMVYDYSHFAFRDLSIEQTVKDAFSMTVQIAVKDAVSRGKEVEFALPGEANTIDYSEILSRFHERGYRGDVCCEVSSLVFRKPGYDPAAATKTCYTKLNEAFKSAKIPRRKSRN